MDCFAEYYLNGEKIHEIANRFIEQVIDVTDALRYDAENVLVVHILSASIKGAEYEVEPHLLFNAYHRTTTALYVRKAPHSYGWDIMPRALSAGIWRDVTLTEECRYGFRYVYPHLQRIDGVAVPSRLSLTALCLGSISTRTSPTRSPAPAVSTPSPRRIPSRVPPASLPSILTG